MALRLARIFKGTKTIETGEGQGGLTPKQVLVRELGEESPVIDLLDDDCCIPTDYCYGTLGVPAERPAGKADIRTMAGTNGQFTIESVCIRYGTVFASYWVRLLDGPWPTPEELVNLCDASEEPDGTLPYLGNFGGTVDRVSETVAMVQVAMD